MKIGSDLNMSIFIFQKKIAGRERGLKDTHVLIITVVKKKKGVSVV